MPLARNDKMLIFGAVFITLGICTGLILWKKPQWFGLAPKTATNISAEAADSSVRQPLTETVQLPPVPQNQQAAAPPVVEKTPATAPQTPSGAEVNQKTAPENNEQIKIDPLGPAELQKMFAELENKESNLGAAPGTETLSPPLDRDLANTDIPKEQAGTQTSGTVPDKNESNENLPHPPGQLVQSKSSGQDSSLAAGPQIRTSPGRTTTMPPLLPENPSEATEEPKNVASGPEVQLPEKKLETPPASIPEERTEPSPQTPEKSTPSFDTKTLPPANATEEKGTPGQKAGVTDTPKFGADQPKGTEPSSPETTQSKPEESKSSKEKEKKRPEKTGRQPAGGTINSITVAETPAEFILMVNSTRPVQTYSTNIAENPLRFIIDINGRWHYRGQNVTSPSSTLVNKVRVGAHPDKLRLVMDLKIGSMSNLGGLPVVDRRPDGITIRIPK